MIEIITPPSGFERYFAELSVLFHEPPDADAIDDLIRRYGLSFDLTWVPDLMDRHPLRHPIGG